MTAGYLQLTLKGGSEAKSGLMQSTTDENTVNFHSRKNKDFLEAKEKIEARISQTSGIQQSRSSADELEKLAALKEKGILSQAEFDNEKAKILGSSS